VWKLRTLNNPEHAKIGGDDSEFLARGIYCPCGRPVVVAIGVGAYMCECGSAWHISAGIDSVPGSVPAVHMVNIAAFLVCLPQSLVN